MKNLVAVVVALALLGVAQSRGVPAQAFPSNRHFSGVCGPPSPHFAKCNADVLDNTSGVPQASASPGGAYGPAQFHTAYNLPCTPGGPVQAVCSQPSSFGPETIAIVDADLDPTVQSDLTTYDTAYGLPSCTEGNGCLRVLNENGGTSLPTTVDGSWALETSLDVQAAHMVCQTCKILLLEATGSGLNDLATAENTAAAQGATAISNSYGAPEGSWVKSYDPYFNHPGVAVVASAGDSGYQSNYPATSPYVVAAGGTTLSLGSNNSYGGETAWSDTGSGCSAYETADTWQTRVSDWNQTSCGAFVGSTDVSADANPNTGAAVYDSTAYSGSSGWWQVGGTSLAAPLIASMFALAGGVPAGANAQSVVYNDFTTSNSHDITSGSNGSCGTVMCNATTGYDGPTGLGSPNGLGGFGGGSAPSSTPTPTNTSTTPPTATPSPTNTPTPSPTNTPTPTPTKTPANTPPPTSTPTPSPTSPPTAENLVINGDFESGMTAWTVTSATGNPILSTAQSYSPTHSAVFCGVNNCTDKIVQSLTLPIGPTAYTLSFWYHVTTAATGTTCTDKLVVRLRTMANAILSTPVTLCNTNASAGWLQASVAVGSALAPDDGKTVKIDLQATSNKTNPTTFAVDDVSLTGM